VNDSFYVKRAISLAKKGLGKTSPNPLVGCVIIKDGKIIGEGHHRRAGFAHAEIEALNKAGDYAKGATLYTNLEPCSHYGKTPPCTDRIIAAGIKKVVFSILDPNPAIYGKEILERSGVEVSVGILEEEAKRLNEVYFKFITQKKPFVILKVGMSVDGKISHKLDRWITCEESRKIVHKLRSQVDAIMIGKGTIIADDPLLTTRIVGGKSPIRIVVTSDGNIPINSRVFGKGTIIIVCAKTPPNEIIKKAKVITIKEKNSLVDLDELLLKLGEIEITSILLEGGKRLITSFLKEGLVDKVILFISPKIIGADGLSLTDSLPFSIKIENIKIKRVSQDFMLVGYPINK